MFTMALLRGILLFSVITFSSQVLSTNVSDTPKQPCSQSVFTCDEILGQIAKLNTKFEQQNTKFEQQNTKLAEQNTKLAEQNIKILEQNNKIKNLKIKIVELEKVDQENQLPSKNDILTNVTVQNTKLAEQNTKIEDLKMKIVALEKVTSSENQLSPSKNIGTGSIFTRWGRSDCPKNVSQLVYPGMTGGSLATHTGGAAEYVCLPLDPSWNENKKNTGHYAGYMFGAEYENIPNLSKKDYQVPCAVCQTSQFSKVLMIPAKAECYPGWQKAYHGELSSGMFDHAAASQYICLDDDPQTKGNNANDNGKLLYPVKARCGSLPCPPYEDYALLTCVVCLN